MIKRFSGPAFLTLVAIALQLSGFKNIWLAIAIGAIAVIWALFAWLKLPHDGTDVDNLAAIPRRTGIRMKDSKAVLKRTKIKEQDIAIDADESELNMEDSEIS